MLYRKSMLAQAYQNCEISSIYIKNQVDMIRIVSGKTNETNPCQKALRKKEKITIRMGIILHIYFALCVLLNYF